MRQEDIRPFDRPLLARRAAPFALGMAIAFASLLMGGNELDARPAVAAALLTLGIAAAAWFVPWTRLPAWLEVLPPFAWFGVATLLSAAAGHVSTGYAPVAFLPVLWLLLYGTRPQVALAVAGLVATLLTPLAFADDAALSDLRFLVLRLLIAAVICTTIVRLVGAFRRQAGELERLASTDGLTGLPNRRVWEETLPRELARSARLDKPVAIALLDLDNFKDHNDVLGHHAGDRLLKESAATWLAELRESDLLARYGGEEFALLLPDCGSADAFRVVDKVRAATPAAVTCSAGVATWDGVESPDDLTRRADEALYDAKRAGRDTTVVA